MDIESEPIQCDNQQIQCDDTIDENAQNDDSNERSSSNNDITTMISEVTENENENENVTQITNDTGTKLDTPQSQSLPHNRKDRRSHNSIITPVSALYDLFHEKHLSPRFVEMGSYGPLHDRQFKMSVHVSGMIFYGFGRTKQMARHSAAAAAVKYFQYNRGFPWSKGERRFDHRSHPYNKRIHPFNHLTPPPSEQFFSDSYVPPSVRRIVDYGHRNPYDAHPHDVHPYDTNPYESHPYDTNPYDPNPYDNPMFRPPLRNDYYDYPRLTLLPTPYDEPIPDPRPALLPHPLSSYESREVFDYPPPDLANPLTRDESHSGDSFHSNDFTSDNLFDENFVKFEEIKDKTLDNDKDNTDVKDQKDNESDVRPNNKKERIILRVMSEMPIQENPISLIHELHADAKWEFIGSEEPNFRLSTSSMFKMKLTLAVANESFIGVGRTKKLAKAAAASKALGKLYNITINPEHNDVTNRVPPKSTIQVAQEPLFLNQEIANKIGNAVTAKCDSVWNTLNDIKKWTVLASIVLTNDFDDNWIDVICITSGTKCVRGDNLSMIGCVVNDCHAEVLSRRCFNIYLYKQIESLMNNNYADDPTYIIERREDGYGFRIKKNIKVHLFISTAPCGDSRVFSPKEENVSDAHPNRITRGLLRAKIEGGEGTIPVKRDAATLTWDGILQGNQRLQFMSCSDKIAVWNTVGIQGALLSHLLEPVYLESVILGSLFNYEHFVRAIHGRLNLNFDSDSLKGLPETYRINKAKVAKSQLKEDITRQLTKAPSYAINWIKGDAKPEVISCDSGRTHNDNEVSRLSKRSLFAQFCSLLGRSAPTLPSCTLGSTIPVIYRDGKTSSHDYQRAKVQVMQSFQEQNLGNWIQVPSEIDLFGLQY